MAIRKNYTVKHSFIKTSWMDPRQAQDFTSWLFYKWYTDSGKGNWLGIQTPGFKNTCNMYHYGQIT